MSGCRLRIHGRVQGVAFRDWAVERARTLGVRGWVKNRRDGSVELVAYGEDEAVKSLAAACRTGPPSARVDHIDVDIAEGEGPPGEFRVAATA